VRRQPWPTTAPATTGRERLGARGRVGRSGVPLLVGSYRVPVTVRLRPILADLPTYRAGKPPPAGGGLYGYKLSSNENPFPPLPGVVEAVAAAAAMQNRYPAPFAVDLEAALAARFGVPASRVVAGAGSVGVLQQLVAATAGDGDEVVFGWRSFEAYPIVVQVGGATAVPVPLTADGRHDLPSMAAAVTERTRMVLLCTPNNPTGPVLGHEEVVAFLDEVPDDVLVVLDEAYVEFVRTPGAVDGPRLARRRRNVALLRTFSKAYGLAGMRVGFAVAPEPVAVALRQVTIPFAVTALAQAAALASLAAERELLQRVDALVTERTRVVGELAAQGWDLPEAAGNFVWLPTGADTAWFVEQCDEARVTVRPFDGEGVRVTVGEDFGNERILEIASRFVDRAAEGAASPAVAAAGAPLPDASTDPDEALAD
jgi:histidinol-phosphate aminotransferase